MGLTSWKTRAAVAVSAAAVAALVGSAPAYAYKLDDGMVELNALGFVNFISVSGNASSAADDAATGAHFERAYLEARYHPEKTDTYRITLDSKNNGDDVFVKYLYGQVQYAEGQSVKFGLGQTPVIDYYENEVWGHRYIAKTFVDNVGAYSSSDLGISFLGDVADMFSYYISLMNGEGYNSTATGVTNGADGAGFAIEGRVEAKVGPARVGVHGLSETNHNGVDGYDPTREGVYVDLVGGWGNFAAEYLGADDGDAATSFDGGSGYSALANVNLPMGNKSKAFARYDSIDAKDTGTDNTLLIVGVETEAKKNLMVAVDVQSNDNGTDTITTVGVHAQVKI